MSRDGFLINDFSGGLNNVGDSSVIAENELAEVKNFILSRTGKLISRPPFTEDATLPSTKTGLKALGYFRNEDGVVFFVATVNGKTYIRDIVAGTWTKIWDYAAEDTTTYLNRLYVVNSTNGGGYWSKVSGSYTFTTISAMPNGNQIHYTKGRIYISSRALSNISTLRYSNITSISAGTSIDEFPTSNYIDVNEGDGEKLIRIVEGNSELFLFRTNSTWRLAFGASAEPTNGTLTVMSNIIGVDNDQSVVELENAWGVLHAGTLYQFAGYNFYAMNPYNKVQFMAANLPSEDGDWTVTSAVSKIGQFVLVWYYGSLYCYDTESNIWTQWESGLHPAYLIEAPRGTLLTTDMAPTAYGFSGYYEGTTGPGLLKFVQDYTDATEQITCSIKTRTYDLGQPTRFKRLFGWEALVVAVNYIEAGISPIDLVSPDRAWSYLQTRTWNQASALLWSDFGGAVTKVITGLPAVGPIPNIIKVSGKQVFKRANFTLSMVNSGDSLTAPSRIDGLVLYLTNGRRAASGRIA